MSTVVIFRDSNIPHTTSLGKMVLMKAGQCKDVFNILSESLINVGNKSGENTWPLLQ